MDVHPPQPPPSMEASPSAAIPPIAESPAPRPRRRVVLWTVLGVVLAGIIGAGVWWKMGRRVWTDDTTIRRAATDDELREVLWSPPKAMDEFNTADQEYEPSTSPDGTELYFVRGKAGKNSDLYVSYRRHNRWTEPAPIAVLNTDADELGPRLTADGMFLLFYSDRPGGVGGYDIWASRRDGEGWAAPVNLGPAINSEFNEYSPAPTPDGARLFFATNRKAAAKEQGEAWRATIRQSGVGDYDLFVSDLDIAATNASRAPVPQAGAGTSVPVLPAPRNTGTEVPVPASAAPATRPALPSVASSLIAPTTRPAQPEPDYPTSLVYKAATEVPGVNTEHHEGASCMSPAGDFLYFSSNRPGGQGKFDLYRVRIVDGVPREVENLGPGVNTPANEADPQLANGGFQLLFSSDREGQTSKGGYDLLRSDSREVYASRTQRNLPTIGWSWWLLLLSLLLLIPLLMMLRNWDDRRLSILQKCLLISLLLHVLLTLWFSIMNVTQQVYQYVKEQEKLEAVIQLENTPEQIVTQEIRQQFTEAKVDVPEPQPMAQAQPVQPAEQMELPKIDTTPPPQAARPDPQAMTIPLPDPRNAPTPPPQAKVEVAPPPVAPAVPEIQVQPQQQVSQAMQEVKPDAAQMQAQRTAVAVPLPAPAAIQIGPAPSATAQEQSMAQPQEAPRPTPAAAPPTPVNPQVAQSPAAMADVQPIDRPDPLAQARPEPEAVKPADATIAKRDTEGPAARPVEVNPGTPTATAAQQPTVNESMARPQPSDVAAKLADTVKTDVQANTPQTDAVPAPQLAAQQPLPRLDQTGPSDPTMSDTVASAQKQAVVAPTTRPTAPPGDAPTAIAEAASSVKDPSIAPKPDAAAMQLARDSGKPVEVATGQATAPQMSEILPSPQRVQANAPESPKATDAVPGAPKQAVADASGSSSPQRVDANAPQAQAVNESMAASPNAPAPSPAAIGPVAANVPARPASEVPATAQPDVTAPAMKTGPLVANAPQAPAVADAAPSAAKQAAADAAKTSSAQQVNTSTPQAQATAESMANAPTATPSPAALGPVAANVPVRPSTNAQDPAKPSVDLPAMKAGPVAANAPQAPAVADGAPGAAKHAVADAASNSSAQQVNTSAPQAQATAESMASAPTASPSPVAIGPVAANVPVRASTNVQDPAQPSVDLPAMKAGPVAANAPQTPAVENAASGAAKASTTGQAGAPQAIAATDAPATADAQSTATAAAPSPRATPAASPAQAVAVNAPSSPAAVPTVNASGAPSAMAKVEATGPNTPSPTAAIQSAKAAPTAGSDMAAVNPAEGMQASVPQAGAAPQSLADAAASAGPRIVVHDPKLLPAGAGASASAAPDVGKIEGPTQKAAAVAAAPAGPSDAPVASGPRTPTAMPVAGGPRPAVLLAPGPAVSIAGIKPVTMGNLDVGPRAITSTTADVTPNMAVATPNLAAPTAFHHRSPEARAPMLEKAGGNKQSEDAVDRALAYLSRQQEPDGRWVVFLEDRSEAGKRKVSSHDMACTGLAVLCFLARDHTPDKEGPYRKTVANGLDFLVANQGADGDLRAALAGKKGKGGGGSAGSNMYDHGIATMAVAEAARMTGDRRLTDAAHRAADFILKSQNPKTGGWRYTPGDTGDMSVFGWQILALHNAEQLNFHWPDQSKELARKFIQMCSGGKTGILAGYTPREGPTVPMSAEALFCRVLLEEKVPEEQVKEASLYITRELPTPGSADVYCWYYASLSLNQMQNDAWKKWNERTRDVLVQTQRRGDPSIDGSWAQSRWAESGGRIFTTALACLTLEVYYRYLPFQEAGPDAGVTPIKPKDELVNRPKRKLEPN